MIVVDLFVVILASVVGVVLILTVALVWLAQKYGKLKREYAEMAQIVQGLNTACSDLHTSAMTVNERFTAANIRMTALDNHINRLAEKIDDVALEQFQAQLQARPAPDAPNHPSGVAIQKVQGGASVSELMQSAGLSQDEAALLIRLHGSKAR